MVSVNPILVSFLQQMLLWLTQQVQEMHLPLDLSLHYPGARMTERPARRAIWLVQKSARDWEQLQHGWKMHKFFIKCSTGIFSLFFEFIVNLYTPVSPLK
jgi:hypothetical protein